MLKTHHHGKSSGVDTGVAHNTISGLQHALHLATVCARWQPLHCLAEVAECTVLLLSMTKIIVCLVTIICMI